MEHGLLSNALVYLAAAVVAVPIAKRLGLGAVLGYLLAGIAIGPWGLGLISEVEVILHFSEFGVVLLLFVIGLELEPKKLLELRRPIFGWGSAQVLGVAAVLCAVAIGFGIEWKVALIAALGLSLSSTAIALTTLEERNFMTTPTGQAGFAILLFQDIAAIPMIALVPVLGMAVHEGSGQGWLGGLKVAGVLAALVVGGRYLITPILRIIARTELREIFTAFALLLVISIALLMQWVGMSMALGAFMAGVLLADSEYRHALETDIEPFKGLLLGLFFIAVGMSVDFGVFMAQPLLILGLVLGFLAIKVGVLYLLAKTFGIPREQQALFAFILSQGGEFAFVVFGAAATARVYSADVAAILVVVVALSMMCTPLLLMLHDRVIAPRFRNMDARPAEHQGANQVKLTVLDHDPDQIETLRRFGFQVFYGDATRIDLLHAAGAAKARALVVAIDDIEDSIALVDAVREAYPGLPILARARNVTHLYRLKDRGVTIIERETFESALMLGRRALEQLGYAPYRARQASLKFREHNLASIDEVYPVYQDQEQYVSMAKRAREELNAMFARDVKAEEAKDRQGWD
jgi:glutathione-regulated potassium-efflux system ancillary protein KefC